eukprot:IDg8532t1
MAALHRGLDASPSSRTAKLSAERSSAFATRARRWQTELIPCTNSHTSVAVGGYRRRQQHKLIRSPILGNSVSCESDESAIGSCNERCSFARNETKRDLIRRLQDATLVHDLKHWDTVLTGINSVTFVAWPHKQASYHWSILYKVKCYVCRRCGNHRTFCRQAYLETCWAVIRESEDFEVCRRQILVEVKRDREV